MNKRKMAVVVGAALFAACGQSMAADGFYKWVDTNGKVHFTDRPPEDGAAKAVTKMKGATAATSQAQDKDGKKEGGGKDPKDSKDPKDKKPDDKASKEAKAKDEAKKAEQEERRALDCKRAQEAVRVLSSGKRVSSVNEKGESVFLDQDETGKRLEDAKKAQESACSQPQQ